MGNTQATPGSGTPNDLESFYIKTTADKDDSEIIHIPNNNNNFESYSHPYTQPVDMFSMPFAIPTPYPTNVFGSAMYAGLNETMMAGAGGPPRMTTFTSSTNVLVTAMLDQLFTSMFSSATHREPVSTTTFTSFPTKKYSEITDPEKCTECTVCRSEFTGDTKITVLPCNHFFDPDCIKRWMTEYHKSCPICRREY